VRFAIAALEKGERWKINIWVIAESTAPTSGQAQIGALKATAEVQRTVASAAGNTTAQSAAAAPIAETAGVVEAARTGAPASRPGADC